LFPAPEKHFQLKNHQGWQEIVTIAAIRVTFGVSLSCGMVGRLFN